MAVVFNWRTSATLYGARDFSRIHRVAAANDVGFKIERLISAVNILNTSVSLVTTALSSLNASGVSVSSLSGVAFASTFATMSNFTA